ncbi:hypothetical protein [Citrobacter freundii]|uniref:hypothetical protein n=1 Tax=Citrobacter freundii TaxID=546 RepID=UPI00301C4973
MSNIDKQALNQEKIEWLNKLADMEYCKSNPGHWLMSLKDTNMLAKLALRSVALLDELEAAEKRIAELEARKFKVEMPESFYPDGDTEVPLVLQEHEVISAIVAAGGIPIAICRRCKSELDLSHRPDGAHYCHGVKGE